MRILLPKGEQQKFMKKILLKISVAEAARFCSLSERTIRDWRREKFLMNKDVIIKLCKKTNVSFPKRFQEKNDYWYADPFLGAQASIKKYGRVGGDMEYRKKKWREWWNKKGQYDPVGCIKEPLPIKIPKFSKDLAEFAGIVIGDGGITQNQVMIFTNSIDDNKYGYFVKKLIKKLFDVNASVYFIDSHTVMIIAVSRKKLVEFCNKKLGLSIGNKLKQGLDIPSWIRKNSEFERACIRGLVDTDGCIFEECHNIKGKKYNYKRVNVVSASSKLRKSIFDILKKNDLCPKVRNNRCVQIENKENINEYFKIIGSHNPKHLNKYYK